MLISRTHMHLYIYIYTLIRKHTHALHAQPHSDTHIHTYMCGYIHTCTYTYMYKTLIADIYNLTNTQCTHARVHMYASYMHTYADTYTLALTPTYVQDTSHTYTISQSHTARMHVYTCTLAICTHMQTHTHSC